MQVAGVSVSFFDFFDAPPRLGRYFNQREEVPPGRSVVREGDEAERFYVVLSGLFAVSQEDLGPRRVLPPGGYFGEVGLAMNVPRTASVRALTQAVVASCDRATFDELLRPLFSDDKPSA